MLCFLDMDGVLADFVGGVCKAHNRPDPFSGSNIGGGAWDMAKGWGITEDEFWKPTERYGFWYGLAKTAEADGIVVRTIATFGVENTCILTAPALNPYCVNEKEVWIKKYYPSLAKQILFTGPAGRGYAKRFLAGPDRVLIDDRDKNIKDFRSAGGVGIVVPRLWNTGWKDNERTLEVVKNELRRVSTSSTAA